MMELEENRPSDPEKEEMSMRCPRCGVNQPVGAKFCMECGAKMPEQETGGIREPIESPVQPSVPAQPAVQQALQEPGMKWFKFLIYFLLWLSALVNLGGAGTALVGLGLQEELRVVYAYLPGLKTLNLVYGVLMIGFAAFTVYTRYRLARFCRNGPFCLCLSYGLNELLSIAYSAAAALIAQVSLTELYRFSSLLASAAMLAVNIVYFRKRQDLFVN